MLHSALVRLRAALGGSLPPLNMWVRTAPRDADHFCWHIDVMPRLAQLAGLEIGAGVHLNVLAPEDAAARLREASV
jgi:UDPglucose--hexose-1-phosphate uridylyltransferase